jgi:hypothetical protein
MFDRSVRQSEYLEELSSLDTALRCGKGWKFFESRQSLLTTAGGVSQ